MIGFLESNKTWILEQWNRRVISEWDDHKASSNQCQNKKPLPMEPSNSFPPSKVVSMVTKRFYSDLIQLLNHQTFEETQTLKDLLSHFRYHAPSFSCVCMVKVFLAKKDILSEILLLDHSENHHFDPQEANFYFEEINDALDQLVRHYLGVLCGHCMVPLISSKEHINELIEPSA